MRQKHCMTWNMARKSEKLGKLEKLNVRPGIQLETLKKMENEKFLHAFSTGQERRNKPESSAAKLYCLHLQEPESKRAREQESKSKREQESKKKNKNKKARERKRTRTRKQEQEKEQEQESKNKKARERMAKPRPF